MAGKEGVCGLDAPQVLQVITRYGDRRRGRAGVQGQKTRTFPPEKLDVSVGKGKVGADAVPDGGVIPPGVHCIIRTAWAEAEMAIVNGVWAFIEENEGHRGRGKANV